jgi:hypothetical protein
MLPFAPAAVAPVLAASPACRPCKRYAIPAPYPLRTLAPSNVPKVAIAGSLPTAAPLVRVSSRSCGFSSNSSFCGFSVSPAPARGSPAGIIALFTCCGPCAMFACRANSTDGFVRRAHVRPDRHLRPGEFRLQLALGQFRLRHLRRGSDRGVAPL